MSFQNLHSNLERLGSRLKPFLEMAMFQMTIGVGWKLFRTGRLTDKPVKNSGSPVEILRYGAHWCDWLQSSSFHWLRIWDTDSTDVLPHE
jgi:hypothetical protein